MLRPRAQGKAPLPSFPWIPEEGTILHHVPLLGGFLYCPLLSQEENSVLKALIAETEDVFRDEFKIRKANIEPVSRSF